jgi:hypothetical protein
VETEEISASGTTTKTRHRKKAKKKAAKKKVAKTKIKKKATRR